jgi:DNA recombination protein RmuC
MDRVAATSPAPDTDLWEEGLEQAERALAEGLGQTPGFLDQYGVWLFAGAAILVVVVMLLMLIGQRHRRAERQSSPLFEEVGDDAQDWDERRPYAEVVIEDPEAAGAEGAYPYRHDEEAEQAFPYNAAEPIEEDLYAEGAEPEIEGDDAHDEEEPRRNVYPLRHSEAAEGEDAYDDEAAYEDDEEEDHDTVQDEPAQRYAFATGRSQVADETPQTSPARETERPRQERDEAAARHDDHHPYVAPFIKEDIERAERRQAERLDHLRDDFFRQMDTLKSEQSSRLDLVIAAIDRKLESLDKRHSQFSDMFTNDHSAKMDRNVNGLSDQVERISSAIDGQGQRIRAITQILETRFAEVGRVHDEVRSVHEEVKSVGADVGKASEAVSGVRLELDEVKEHVGRLERAILDRAAQDSATTVKLADVIRGTLPDNSYEFGATLANGETADCLVRFEGLKDKIAIDAGFPMEAFHELPSRDAVRRNLPQAKGAEDAFRRAILRAILEAADRCISPKDTADSCLLFLPSEAAYTILHDRFPDLVRDSQRARVWLVSPSTLMGTLNLMRNLLPETEILEDRAQRATEEASRREEEQRLKEEVTALRRRAASLAEELDRTRGTLRDLISTSDRLEASVGTDDRARAEATDDEDEEMIESLRFEGTPEWSGPVDHDDDAGGRSSRYDEDRVDTLR